MPLGRSPAPHPFTWGIDQRASLRIASYVEFSRELRDDVLAGDITLSVLLWKRPLVK